MFQQIKSNGLCLSSCVHGSDRPSRLAASPTIACQQNASQNMFPERQCCMTPKGYALVACPGMTGVDRVAAEQPLPNGRETQSQ